MNIGTHASSIEEDILWSKELILRCISQEEIFERYLNVKIRYGVHFISPERKDSRPTCSFTWKNGKLLYRDWAQPRAKDCFDVVKEYYNVDFYTALQKIAYDFSLTNKTPRSAVSSGTITKTGKYYSKNNDKSIIEVATGPFTRDNIAYLKSYYLNSRIIRYFKVFGIKKVWLNGNPVYLQNDDNPAIGYYFGVDDRGRQKWKIYYYRNKEFRFIGNTNRINGWVQIPEKGPFLVITKSMKDVMCLARFGIPAVAMQAETQIPYDYIIDELKSRFDKIITILDFDLTGVRSAQIIRKKYNIPALFVSNKRRTGIKDFSDYLQVNGIQESKELIYNTLRAFDVSTDIVRLIE